MSKAKANPKIEALFDNPRGRSLRDRYGPKLFDCFEADIKAIIARAGDGPMPSIRSIRDYLNETYGVSLSYSGIYEHFQRLKRGK